MKGKIKGTMIGAILVMISVFLRADLDNLVYFIQPKKARKPQRKMVRNPPYDPKKGT